MDAPAATAFRAGAPEVSAPARVGRRRSALALDRKITILE
jgi:hypothetical protein